MDSRILFRWVKNIGIFSHRSRALHMDTYNIIYIDNKIPLKQEWEIHPKLLKGYFS